MAAAALIKFTQGATTDTAGRAVKGATGSAVVASNGDNTGVTAWAWYLLDAPETSSLLSSATPWDPNASALPVGSPVSTLSTYTFTPDVSGTYQVALFVNGVSALFDVRDFGIDEPTVANGLIPALRSDHGTANYSGSKRGYKRGLEALFRAAAAALSTTAAAAAYATKTALTGTGYVKGSGSYPPAFVSTIALADLANSGGASGDVTYWNGSNWVRLAKGTDGQVLTLASGVPSWAAAASTTTVTNGTGISVTGGPAYTVALDASSSPTLTGLTLSGLTASKYVVTNGSKALASQTGVPWSDLTGVSAASPTFTGLTLSGLGAGIVRSSSGGVLSSSAFALADIPTGTGYLKGSGGAPAYVSTVARADLANSGGAVGDLWYWDGSNMVRLAAVATGSVLKSAGVSTAPAWGTLGLSDLTSGSMGAFDLSTTGTWYSGGTSAQSGSASQAKDVNVAAGSSATVISFTPPANATVKVNFSCVAHGGGLSYYCDVVGLIRTSSLGVITIVTAFSTINVQGDAGAGYVTFSAASSGGDIVLTAAISVGASATYRCAAEVGRLKAVA